MSGCEDQTTECPLCMEPLEMDDINFFPCTCGYQICRFCWHRIRTNENGLCPACRKQYPEDPADFKPLTQEELQRIKNEKRQKDLQKKLKISENRKHLSNVRVVQKNLVFVVGLAHRLADPEVLKKHEYFGKFGKIHKVVINHSTTYAGSQGPSASAYVTYYRVEDALRAIQSVNNVHVDGRTLKASLGTTKYCSHFLKGQQCPKTDCMYLHELGDDAASFTKEEMQQGKHQEYEKKLHEQLFNSIRKQATSPTNNSSSPTNSNSTSNNSLAQDPDASTRDSWPALRSGSGSSNSSDSYRGSKQPGKLENGFSQTRNGIRTRTDSGEDNNVNRNKGLDDFPIESNNHLVSGFNSFSPRSLQSSENGMDSPHQNNMGYVGSVGTNGGSATNSATCNAIANSIPSSFNSNLSNGPSLSRTSSNAGSPSQSLANLDSSSSSSSSSSPDNVTPYFESRNGFTEASLQPVTTSLNEWTNNLTIENNIDPLPPVEAPRQENTDWQAAFGFSSPVREPPPRDDDLGFDPWDESKKGLADLIEKESSGRPHMLPAYIHNVNHGFQYGESSNTHHHHQLKQQHLPNIVHMNGPLQQPQQHHFQQPTRRLGAPPPGFFPNTMATSLKMTRPYPHDDYQLHHSVMNPHPYSNQSFSNLSKAHHMKEVNLRESQGNIRHYDSKESQDNLRALFPNVNITFGNNSGPLSQQPNCAKSWHCGGGHDSSWPIQDPAVVSAGGVSEGCDPYVTHGSSIKGEALERYVQLVIWEPTKIRVVDIGRPESPPHWMSSIHQLTELDYPVNYNSHQFPVNQFQNRHLPGWTNQSQTPPGFGNPLRLAFRSNEPQKIMDAGNF